MFSTLVAAAPFAHPGFAFLPFFIIGHVFWGVVIILVIAFAIGGRRRRMARWAAFNQGGFAHGGFGHGGFGPGAFGGYGHAARAAESTLAERFAQGDIDEKEYRARLEVLRANSAPQTPAS